MTFLVSGLQACAAPGGAARLIHDPRAKPASVVLDSGPVVGVGAPAGRVWLGLPYAAPPVGALRWRPPRPPMPWTLARKSVRLGPDCVQNLSPRSLLGRQGGLLVRGSEDCLYLNVYAPSNARRGQWWPVMVWLPGGGFVAGTSANYDPSVLAQKAGVIVVTVNYRLGAFGFFAHPALSAEQGSSGNYGLLDQQAALRWVAANVAAFGGDPSRVTLFGESAGGFSICHHLASPGAAGLFVAAIIQSGACVGSNLNVPMSEAERAGLRTAGDLGCNSPRKALDCLRAVPPRRLARAVSHRMGALGFNGWGAVIGDGLLPVPMEQAFASGRFNHVPVIAGSNRDEGRVFAVFQRLSGRLSSAESYRTLMEERFGAEAERVLALYRPRTYGSVAAAYAAVITDSAFACETLRLDRLLAPQTPTYSYEFADEAAVSNLPNLPTLPRLQAYHGSEIAYLFQRPWVMADPARFDVRQKLLSDRMQAFWAAFAHTGDPNDPDRTGPRTWPAQSDGQSVILGLSPSGVAPVQAYADDHRCGFWATISN